MLCAACHAETSVDPCAACGQSPLLDGRWRLEEEVGRGRWGATWRATDGQGGPAANSTVAIKMVPLPQNLDPKLRQLLDRETAVLRQLSHPGIPAYIEHFERGSGRLRALYIVQEFIPGPTLEQELADRRYRPDEVLVIAAELLAILDYLHGLSPPVVHRDLKPANVIRRPDGRLALIDFGAVRDTLQDPALGGSTVAGTFGYMAPEQFRGDADPRTDLYALGALAVRLLTRREPRTLLDHQNRIHFRDHLQVPPGVRALLERLLASDPDRRPASARDALALVGETRAAPNRPRPAPAPEARAVPLQLDEPTADAAAVDALFEPEVDQLPAAVARDALATTHPQAAQQRLLLSAVAGVLTALVVAGMVAALLVRQAPPPPRPRGRGAGAGGRGHPGGGGGLPAARGGGDRSCRALRGWALRAAGAGREQRGGEPAAGPAHQLRHLQGRLPLGD